MAVYKPIVEHLRLKAGSSGVEYLFVKPYSGRLSVRWHVLACIDWTNAPTRVDLCYRHGTVEYIVKAEKPSAAGNSVTVVGDILFPGDFEAGCIVTGATEGDMLDFYAYGEIIYPAVNNAVE